MIIQLLCFYLQTYTEKHETGMMRFLYAT